MKKFIFLSVFLIIVLISAVIFALPKSTQVNLVENVNKNLKSINQKLTVSLKDEKNYDLIIKDNSKFSAWSKKMGFSGNLTEFAVLGDYLDLPLKWVKPAKINFFHTREIQPYSKQFTVGRKVVFSLRDQFDEKANTLDVFFQTAANFEKDDEITATRQIEYFYLYSMYLLTNYAPKKNSTIRMRDFLRVVEDYHAEAKNGPLFFQITKKTSFFNLFVREAMAACTGSYSCGNNVYTCPNGNGCSPGSTCPDGTDCGPHCEPVADKNCSSTACGVQCVGGPDCSIGGCINPTGPVPSGPTSPPGPTEPPPPACNEHGPYFIKCGGPTTVCTGNTSICPYGFACMEYRTFKCGNHTECLPDPDCYPGTVNGNVLDAKSSQYLKPLGSATSCTLSKEVSPLNVIGQNKKTGSNTAATFSCNAAGANSQFGFWTAGNDSGGFETSLAYVHSGQKSYRITAGTSHSACVSQGAFDTTTNPLLANPANFAGRQVTFSAWVKTTGSATGRLQLSRWVGGTRYAWWWPDGVSNPPTSSNSTWTKIEKVISVPANTTRLDVNVCLPSGGVGNSLYIDDISLTPAGGSNLIVNPSFEDITQYAVTLIPDQIHEYHQADVFLTPPADATNIQWKTSTRNLIKDPNALDSTWKGNPLVADGAFSTIIFNTQGGVMGCFTGGEEARQTVYLSPGTYKFQAEAKEIQNTCFHRENCRSGGTCTRNPRMCPGQNTSLESACITCAGDGRSCATGPCPEYSIIRDGENNLCAGNSNPVSAFTIDKDFGTASRRVDMIYATNNPLETKSQIFTVNSGEGGKYKLAIHSAAGRHFQFRNLRLERVDAAGNVYQENAWINYSPALGVPGVPIWPNGPITNVNFQLDLPPPPTGTINVNFASCQSGETLPATPVTVSTSATTPVFNTSATGALNGTTPLTNLLLNAVGTTTYTTTAVLPAGWLPCNPPLSRTSVLSGSTLSANVTFNIQQNIGNWVQTFGGNVHTQTGYAWGTPKSLVPLPQYFNLVNATREIGLITASGTLTCPDLTGTLNDNCHVLTKPDWRSASNYSISSSTTNLISYDEFTNWVKNKTDVNKDPELGQPNINPSFRNKSDGAYDFGSLNVTVTASGLDVGTKKLAIFTTGTVTISGDITVNSAGGGFFAIFGKNGMSVDKRVNSIAGIYLTDEAFTASNTGSANDTPLTVTGSVIAGSLETPRQFQTLSLTQSTPIVKFSFDPFLLIYMPEYLRHDTTFDWNEIEK